MKYTMWQIRQVAEQIGLYGKVIKFLWFMKKGDRPKKCRAKILNLYSEPKWGNCLVVIGLRIGRRYLGKMQWRIPIRSIIILAGEGLDGCALLENHLKIDNSVPTLPDN